MKVNIIGMNVEVELSEEENAKLDILWKERDTASNKYNEAVKGFVYRELRKEFE